MEGFKVNSVAFQYFADRLVSDKFTLIDVGCSGKWIQYGGRLVRA